MQACPECKSSRIYRSQTRTALEKLQKVVTGRRLFRCHACDWRGWGVETDRPGERASASMIERGGAPDLSSIDVSMMRERASGKTARESKPSAPARESKPAALSRRRVGRRRGAATTPKTRPKARA